MRITSCDCLERKREQLANYYSPFSQNKLFVKKDKKGFFDIGIGSLIIASHIKYCPYCGKKIEVVE